MDPADAGPGPGSSVSPPTCLLTAIGSAIPSGILGWFFGFVPSAVRNRKLSLWRTWMDDGGASAKNLMLFSGVYGFTHCLLVRIRQTDDAFNRGAAGCATGLAVGWSGGPAAAAQSCLGIGMLSAVIDFGSMGGETPAHAVAASSCVGGRCCGVDLGGRAPAGGGTRRTQAAAHMRLHAHGRHATTASTPDHRLPPVMWLGAALSQGGCAHGYFGSVPFSDVLGEGEEL